MLAWCSVANGPPAHYTASTTLGGSRLQERTWLAKDRLERRSQERSAMNGTHLGGGSSRQIRMASVCGPVFSHGRGMNQGQLNCSVLSGTLSLYSVTHPMLVDKEGFHEYN